MKFLEQLCHEHGVFSARNTHGDLVAFLNKLVLLYGFYKAAHKTGAKLGADAFLHFFAIVLVHFFLHFGTQPLDIAAGKRTGVYSLFAKRFGNVHAEHAVSAINNRFFIECGRVFYKFVRIYRNRARNETVSAVG